MKQEVLKKSHSKQSKYTFLIVRNDAYERS